MTAKRKSIKQLRADVRQTLLNIDNTEVSDSAAAAFSFADNAEAYKQLCLALTRELAKRNATIKLLKG